MISHHHKCIFIHIPKCAGTSIEEVLGHFDGHDGRAGQDHRSIRMIQQPWLGFNVLNNAENVKDAIRRLRERFRSHANPNNKMTVSEVQFDTYFKFTLIRNPWTRALSWYKNVMRDPIHQKNYNIEGGISFAEFMQRHIGTGYLRPQTYWLKDFSGKIPLDYIAKFESLEKDFTHISKTLGLKTTKLPHKIAGEKSNPKQHFDDKTIDLIADFYQEEIKLFDYNFD